jgi:hypothetical protein
VIYLRKERDHSRFPQLHVHQAEGFRQKMPWHMLNLNFPLRVGQSEWLVLVQFLVLLCCKAWMYVQTCL